MSNQDERIGAVVVFGGIAFALWLFVPRAGWGDEEISYSVRASFCNEHLFCNVQEHGVLEPVTLRVDTQRAEVVWFDASTREINRFLGCAILDKANWTCDGGNHKMRDGIMEDNFADVADNIHHMAGYMWRLNWLGSLASAPRNPEASAH